MAYLAGDNSLSEDMVLQLQQVRGADLSWHARVVAQLDPSGVGIPTQRFLLNEDNTGPNATGKTLDDVRVVDQLPMDESNTGNPGALSGFVGWAVNSPKTTSGQDFELNGEADYYALILSGHGSGATEDFLLKDEAAADSLTVPELREALKNACVLLNGENLEYQYDLDGDVTREIHKSRRRERRCACDGQPTGSRKIDLLGMDACFMNMLEVCYEIRDYIDVMVGAEGFEPDFGWPYHRILRRALEEQLALAGSEGVPPETRALTPSELAIEIVDGYVDYYRDYDRTVGRSVDLAAVRMRFDGQECIKDLVETHLNELGVQLQAALPNLKNEILLAHLEAQTYKFEQFVDLRDFCQCLKDGLGSSMPSPGNPKRALWIACRAVMDQVQQCVLVSSGVGSAYQYSWGLSVYFPWARLWEAYENLAVKQGAPEWVKFLSAYLEATRRDQRPDSRLTSTLDEEAAALVGIDLEETEINVFLETIDVPAGQRDAYREACLEFHRYARSRYARSRYARSRYARSRYARSRYARSRYARSRYAEAGGDHSVKNFERVSGWFRWP
jgi:hypothetical protein